MQPILDKPKTFRYVYYAAVIKTTLRSRDTKNHFTFKITSLEIQHILYMEIFEGEKYFTSNELNSLRVFVFY